MRQFSALLTKTNTEYCASRLEQGLTFDCSERISIKALQMIHVGVKYQILKSGSRAFKYTLVVRQGTNISLRRGGGVVWVVGEEQRT